jgi:hypothetical protein
MSIFKVFNWLKESGIARKFNQNHDEQGRFTESSGNGPIFSHEPDRPITLGGRDRPVDLPEGAAGPYHPSDVEGIRAAALRGEKMIYLHDGSKEGMIIANKVHESLWKAATSGDIGRWVV